MLALKTHGQRLSSARHRVVVGQLSQECIAIILSSLFARFLILQSNWWS